VAETAAEVHADEAAGLVLLRAGLDALARFYGLAPPTPAERRKAANRRRAA
jgi:hypothetical protein